MSPSPETGLSQAMPTNTSRQSRWVFVALCGYIASQAYTVPIVPIGPWPVWPGLPDIAFGLLVVAWLVMNQPAAELNGIRRTAMRLMAGFVVACVISYVVFTLLIENLATVSFGADQQGPAFGLFEVVRLVQFLVLFRIALTIDYTPFRLAVLRRIVTAVLLFVSVTVLITFQDTVSSGTFAPFLPRDKETAGAWWYYVHNYDGFGLGAISYTHAYVAAQITLLLGLALHLRGPRDPFGNGLLITLAMIASLLSGSRAGFVGVALVAAAFLLARSAKWFMNVVLLLASIAVGTFVYVSSQPPSVADEGALSSIVQHQIAAFQPYQEDNLVGRQEIWAGRIDNLISHPWHWFTGWGFGSSPDTGPALSPHMLPLQIVMELGILMLFFLGLVAAAMLRNFWRREGGDRSFLWVTIALLVSSATQETFYPVPSTGYFLGFYLVAVAIVIRTQTDPGVVPGSAPRTKPANVVWESPVVVHNRLRPMFNGWPRTTFAANGHHPRPTDHSRD